MPALFSRQFDNVEKPSREYLDESNVASILGITGAFAFAALVVVTLRLYVRTCMLRFVGLDDWSMILAALMAVGTFVCFCGESLYGMGHHREWQQPWMIEPFFRWLFAHGLIVMLGVVLVKISIAFFLMRIMLQKRWKIFLWSSVVFLVCFALACAGTLIFQCTPAAASWSVKVRMRPGTRCFSDRTYSFIGLWNSIVNIITDILFAILPIPVILKLQVNKRTKITLIVVLSLGFIACIAGILKARLQLAVYGTPDPGFENSFSIWYMLELCLGILAASLPTLKPLFAAVLDGTRSRSRGTAERYAGSGKNSRGRPNGGPTPFPDPTNDVDLAHYKKGSGATGTTLAEMSSATASSDADAGNSPYDVRVTGGMKMEDSEQWDSREPARCGSQERLHHPASGIFKKVELSRTSEVASR